jgi:capsular exopolysaccharide synthesis family protein
MPVNITIALLSSLLISAIAGLSSEALDSSVRDPEQIGRMLHTEVVGIIPMVKGKSGPGGPGTGENAEESGFSESIRTLSNSLLNGEMKPSVGTLLVTSAAPREGKSTVAAWLATANAKQGLKTLLIDVDLKAPCLHKYLGIERGSGIADILRTEIEWRKAVVTIAERGGLCVLTAGSDPMPADGVRGVALMALIKEARKEYQTVILDGPPLLGFADPTQLARMVEGVLVVAKAGVTDRRALSDVLDRLDRLHAKVLGVVLNQINETMSGAHYYSTRKYRASMKERTPVGSGV